MSHGLQDKSVKSHTPSSDPETRTKGNMKVKVILSSDYNSEKDHHLNKLHVQKSTKMCESGGTKEIDEDPGAYV